MLPAMLMGMDYPINANITGKVYSIGQLQPGLSHMGKLLTQSRIGSRQTQILLIQTRIHFPMAGKLVIHATGHLQIRASTQ